MKTIKLKRSAIQGNIPTTGQLELGEVGINTYDGKMFIKKDDGHSTSVIEVGGGAGTGLESITEGSNTGWRLVGRNPNDYGNIGEGAIDFSAEGYGSLGATGKYAFAEGATSLSSGYCSHAEGHYNTASGDHSHAEGYNNQAQGSSSHAEGENTLAQGNYSHAEGENTIASGYNSHAEGSNTIAQNSQSHAAGVYNIGTSLDTIHETGIGTSDVARANAFEIYTDGTITAPESTPALITTRGDKSLVTKEYLESTPAMGTITGAIIDDYTNFVHADATHARIKANVAIGYGDALAYAGYNDSENAIEVVLADNTTGVSIGISHDDLLTGEFGLMVSNGIIENVDTSAFSAADILYVGTSGALTATEPTTGFAQPIAFVLKVQANNGVILVDASYPKQPASDVRYDNTTSGLTATQVQAAIDEIVASGTGIPEAPQDGKQYVRQDGAWVELV